MTGRVGPAALKIGRSRVEFMVAEAEPLVGDVRWVGAPGPHGRWTSGARPALRRVRCERPAGRPRSGHPCVDTVWVRTSLPGLVPAPTLVVTRARPWPSPPALRRGTGSAPAGAPRTHGAARAPGPAAAASRPAASCPRPPALPVGRCSLVRDAVSGRWSARLRQQRQARPALTC